jgi:hypothetical protein
MLLTGICAIYAPVSVSCSIVDVLMAKCHPQKKKRKRGSRRDSAERAGQGSSARLRHPSARRFARVWSHSSDLHVVPHERARCARRRAGLSCPYSRSFLSRLRQIQTISDPDNYTAVSGGSMHFLCFRSRKRKNGKISI